MDVQLVTALETIAAFDETRRLGLGLGEGHASRRRALGGLLACAAVGSVAAGCSSSPSAAPPKHHTDKTTTTHAATTTTTAAGPLCPLTGLPSPPGVPARPALAFKVDNYPTARPQTGLTKADIIFEEPVEGGITRYVVIFQCQTTSQVGPVRSARNIDIGILGEFGKPLLVHVGGITPVIDNINASPIVNLDLEYHGSDIQNVPGRYAPYDTYTSTTDMWGLEPTDKTAPAAVFAYSTTVPTGPAATTVSVPFSSYSEVVWKYDASTKRYMRYFGTAPDNLSNGTQNSATNVIVQYVHVTYGPWVENTEGGLEVQANLYQTASGTAIVFRDGVEVAGHWARSSLGQATQFTTTAGAPIDLAPGSTWVELVPTTVTAAVTATATPAG